MSDSNVLLDLRDSVAWITLNRPDAMNTISLTLATELANVAGRVAAHPSVRCVVLTGAGNRAFCAGGDVGSFAAQTEQMDQLLEAITVPLHLAISHFANMDKPLIGAINGVAAGAGLSLTACCDIAIAVDTARFTSAYTQLGLTPDGSGTWYLPRVIGTRRATELFLTNRVLSAEEALDWGLINRIVAPETLGEAVGELARQLARGPTTTFGAVKKLMLASDGDTLESQMARETRAICAAGRSVNGVEGVVAFVTKRPPEFSAD